MGPMRDHYGMGGYGMGGYGMGYPGFPSPYRNVMGMNPEYDPREIKPQDGLTYYTQG